MRISSLTSLAIGTGLLVTLLAAKGCGRLESASAVEPVGIRSLPTGAPLTGHMMNLSGIAAPRQPLGGVIGGEPFVLDHVDYHESTNVLLLHGKARADGSVGPVVFVFLPEAARGGMAVDVLLPKDGPEFPHVHVHHVDMPASNGVFSDGFVMRLDLGPKSGAGLPARFSLCLPDEHESWIGGTFALPLR
jgi:hypothetical protein